MSPLNTLVTVICRRCQRPLGEHGIYFGAPPEGVVVQYGEFDIPATGLVCPTTTTEG